jgi:flagellar basal-body rod protein FlgG
MPEGARMVRAIWLSLLVGGAYLASWAVAWSPADAEPLGSALAETSPPRDASAILGRGDKTQAETLKVLAHNLANAGTMGFKSRHVVAEAVELREGGGTRQTVRTDFRQGDLIETGRELDLAVFGRGFFQVCRDDGLLMYTRRGDLSANSNGMLVLRIDGRELWIDAPITIPSDALSVHIDQAGIVEVEQRGQCERSQIGQLQLATFINVDGLKDVGGGLYEQTEDSGTATVGNPEWEGLGTIRQGRLEASNVDVEATIEQYRDALLRLGQLRAMLAR